jgi:hypothetical protein
MRFGRLRNPADALALIRVPAGSAGLAPLRDSSYTRAALQCSVHVETEATGKCARCGAAFCQVDRRTQLRGGDLCQRCHLDPRARALPVEVAEGSWMLRCLRTLFVVVRAPNAFARRVAEPVEHGKVVGFLATLRLPLWGIVLAGLLVQWMMRDPERPLPLMPTALSDVFGMQLVNAMSLYLLLLVPLLLPAMYFFAGDLAHLALALTGGARRSIGATMRAVGYAATPFILVIAVLEVPLRLWGLNPDVWVYVMIAAAVPAFVFIGLAIARTHSTTVLRGLLCAVLPIAFLAASVTSRALLDMSRVPFSPPVEMSPYAPYYLPPLE